MKEEKVFKNLKEISDSLSFLADNFDQVGNSYMYETLSEFSEKIETSIYDMKQILLDKELFDITEAEFITNNIISNLTK